MEHNQKLSNSIKAYELWNKAIDQDFTEEEVYFLKNHIKTLGYKVKYGFYKKISAAGKQIAFIFDSEPLFPRRSGAENQWEIVCERDISESEIIEFIIFYFRNQHKRFLVFYYKNIEKLILDDLTLGADTPDHFIKLCKKKGYNNIVKNNFEFKNRYYESA